MDFVSAEPIIQALHQRIDHGVFGYNRPTLELRTVIQQRLKKVYQWEIGEEEIVFLPGLVTGLNLFYHAFSNPGDGVLLQPPVYFPFIKDPVNHGRVLDDPPLVQKGDTYQIDFTLFEKAIKDRTKVFLFCNPHKPVARVFTSKELEKVAEICLRHGIFICSDEIHCDLLYPGYQHVAIATLGPEVAKQTITLMAPSKTYNLARHRRPEDAGQPVPRLPLPRAPRQEPQLRRVRLQGRERPAARPELQCRARAGGLPAAAAAARPRSDPADGGRLEDDAGVPGCVRIPQGRLHEEVGDLASAEAAYRKGMEIEPGAAEYPYLLGSLLYGLGREQGHAPMREQGLALLRRAVELNQQYFDWYGALYSALWAEGQREAALEVLT